MDVIGPIRELMRNNRSDGFTCTPVPFEVGVTASYVIPEFSVVITPVSVTVNIEDYGKADDMTRSSVTQGSCVYTLDQAKKFVHEFTFGQTEETDRKLLEVFGELDSKDCFTPDIIDVHDGWVCVIELATRHTTSERQLRGAYLTKLDRYGEALKKRSTVERPISFGIVVVGIRSVAAPVNISQDLCNDLVARYNFALAVQKELTRQGLEPYTEMTSELSKTNMMSVISRIKVQTDDSNPRYLTQKKYDDCLKHEVNVPYVAKSYMTAYNKGVREKRNLPKPLPTDIYTNNVLHCLTHEKAVTRVPLVLAQYCASSSLFPLPEASGMDTPYAEMWDLVINQTQQGTATESPEDIDGFVEKAQEGMELDKAHRRQYRRVTLNLSDEVLETIAEQGVGGKKRSKTDSLIATRKSKEGGFNASTSLEDIDEFLVKEFPVGPSTQEALMLKALSENAYMAQNSLAGGEDIKTMFDDPYFRVLNIISDIGMEISLSLKQHVKRDVYVFKKLRMYDLYLLIKPTKSDSHIFVSFMMPNRRGNEIIQQKPFVKMVDYVSYWASDFVSFDKARIANLVKCPFVICSLKAYFEDQGLCAENVTKNLNFSLLVMLEDKLQTEEMLSLVRHVCMKKFQLSKIPDTLADLESKFPFQMRTRLGLWVANRIQVLARLPKYTMETEETEAGPAVKWVFTHPLFDYHMTDVQQLVDSFFLGYLKDKNQKTEANVDSLLITKILEEEMELENWNSLKV
jgi:hypothetical protein